VKKNKNDMPSSMAAILKNPSDLFASRFQLMLFISGESVIVFVSPILWDGEFQFFLPASLTFGPSIAALSLFLAFMGQADRVLRAPSFKAPLSTVRCDSEVQKDTAGVAVDDVSNQVAQNVNKLRTKKDQIAGTFAHYVLTISSWLLFAFLSLLGVSINVHRLIINETAYQIVEFLYVSLIWYSILSTYSVIVALLRRTGQEFYWQSQDK
jgi:hypothetical protein